MRKTIALAALLLCVAFTLFGAEDWRGNNRLSGVVVDKTTGKPVPDAKVALRIQKGGNGGPDVTADKNGKWAVLGLASGGWNIDVQAAGYETRQLSFGLQEGQRLPPMKVELAPVVQAAAPSAAAEAPKEEVKIGGQTVSKEVADAVEAGNTALAAKDYKAAVADYEKASAALPSFMPIKLALSRAYYGAGDVAKAASTLGEVYNSDPTNTQVAALYANMLLEQGKFDEAKAVFDKLPPTALDMNTLLNAGIALMNKKKPAAAIEYFSKAIALDANSHLGYYYRGLALIQEGKAKTAKPDLQKVIALSPDSQEAKDSQEYLKSIK